MKTMTARDAKTRFGEFLDTMQREPVMVTKNNRPVGIMLSIEDASEGLIADLFLPPEPGYEAWLQEKVSRTLQGLENGSVGTSPLNEVRTRLQVYLEKHRTTAL